MTTASYAEILHSIRFKKCLRHPDKLLVVQHLRERDEYVPHCAQCGVEGYKEPALGKADTTAERMWDMTTRQIVRRDERIDALTVPTIKELIPVGRATDNEVRAFIMFCQSANANPFLKEAYLIKYADNSPASIVLSLQWYLKRASHVPAYESYESGVIVKRGNVYQDVVGSVVYPNDELFGGWCKVYKKGTEHPFERRVTMAEYNRRQAQWLTMPATMIEKVAIVQCVRRAFPDEFIGQDEASLPIVIEGEVTEMTSSNGAPKSGDQPMYDDICPIPEHNQAKMIVNTYKNKLGHVLDGTTGPKGGRVWCYGEAAQPTQASAGAASEPAVVSQQGETAQTGSPIPPFMGKNLGDLWTYGTRFLGYKSKAEMLAVLGVKDDALIGDLQEAAAQLAAAKTIK